MLRKYLAGTVIFATGNTQGREIGGLECNFVFTEILVKLVCLCDTRVGNLGAETHDHIIEFLYVGGIKKFCLGQVDSLITFGIVLEQ
jgi:hypothetical protein